MLCCVNMSEVCSALESVKTEVSKLSKQVKVYGAVVTFASLIIPAYSQISTAMADSRIEKAVSVQVGQQVPAAVSAQVATQVVPVAQQAAARALELSAGKALTCE